MSTISSAGAAKPKAKKAATDKVGPGNPPKATRFQPGKSGNPAGRPRKDRDLLKLFEAELDVEVQLTESGNVLRLSKREALVKRVVNDAISGDFKALTILMRILVSSGIAIEREEVVVSHDTISRYLNRMPPDKEAGS